MRERCRSSVSRRFRKEAPLADALTAQIEQHGAWHVIRLAGVMREGAEELLAPLTASAGANCIFDFGRVTAVNSSGIAEWMEFRAKFDKNRVVVLQALTPPVVTVANLMTAFVGTARIRSVFFPMVCTACLKPAESHLEIAPGFTPDKARDHKAACPKCSAALEPQVDVDDYFAFVS
jgi:hypothetical protein